MVWERDDVGFRALAFEYSNCDFFEAQNWVLLDYDFPCFSWLACLLACLLAWFFGCNFGFYGEEGFLVESVFCYREHED